jgi:hypothetical protein
VNPLAEDDAGRLVAADAKLGFDDSASYRQMDIFELKDESQLDPRCVAVTLFVTPTWFRTEPEHAFYSQFTGLPGLGQHVMEAQILGDSVSRRWTISTGTQG